MNNVPSEWVGLIISGLCGIVLSIVAAVMARRGSKLGNRETRAPDVQEMWAQQEADRRMRQLVEDLWWNLRRAFQSYFRRVTGAVGKMNLTEAQAKVFELTPKELAAIEARPPEESE